VEDPKRISPEGEGLTCPPKTGPDIMLGSGEKSSEGGR